MRNLVITGVALTLLGGCFATALPWAKPAPNTGLVTTMDVQGVGNAAAVTADAAGNVYVACLDGLLKISTDGTAKKLAEVKPFIAFPNPDMTRTITDPRAMAIDRSGNLYVTGYQIVYVLSPDGKLTTRQGPPGDWGDGIAVDSNGNVVVSIANKDTLYRVPPSGPTVVLAGQDHHLEQPPGPIGTGYVDGAASQALFRQPMGLAFDSHDNLLVADSNNGAIRRIDAAGNVTTFFGRGRDTDLSSWTGSSVPTPQNFIDAKVISATHLAVTSNDEVFAASRDKRIWKFSATGEASVLAGSGATCSADYGAPATLTAAQPVDSCYQDGQGVGSQFASPRGIAVDGHGVLYVVDGNSLGSVRIRQIK